MALLGGQLAITLIVTCIIQKLSPHFSFAQWIISATGLKRYLHPSDDDLKDLSGISKDKSKGKNYTKTKSTSFYVPKNIDLQLRTIKIAYTDIVHLRYFEEYKWLIDFSIYTALVYILSEVFHYYFPRRGDVNLSLIWCLIVILYAIKYLSSLTLFYFKYDKSMGERSMCIIAFFVYLLIAMIVLISDERILETGLEEAYDSFNRKATKFLTELGLPSTGVTSKIVVKFFIAVSCGLLGSIFLFPGLRISKMHRDSLRYCKDDKIMQLALNISFILPFLLVILWIRPISRDYLTIRVFGGMDRPVLTSHGFEIARLLIVLFAVLLRFSLLPVYIQSYLNLAYDRIQDMRKEAGRITNLELQTKISSIFHYLCVVILQFAAPIIICFYLALLYKNLSGITWTSSGKIHSINSNSSIHRKQTFDDEYSILNSVTNLQITLSSLKEVFNVKVFRGLLGFALWWTCFTLFSTSSFGLLYHSYFTKM